jgi:hypothetical protein
MRVLCSLACGVAVQCGSAVCDADPQPEASPAAVPRTTDELAQLYGVSAAYGFLTGVWVHELVADGTAPSLVLPAVSVAALGIGATALLDQRGSLSLGQPQAIVSDTWIGAEIGAAWLWHYHAAADREDEWSAASQTTLLWSAASAGAVIGIVRYELSPSRPGRAAFTGSAALWTGAFSGLVAGALTADAWKRDDNASLATAIGLEAGVVAGSLLGRWRAFDPDISWVRLLDAGAVVGGTLLSGAYVLGADRELHDRGVLALGAAGVALGITSALILAPALDLPHTTAFWLGPDLALGRDGIGIAARGQL